MSEWIILDPPIPFGSVYDKIPDDGKRHQLVESDSLQRRNLSKPGTMIRTEDGREYLIGDINELGGGCDDCPNVGTYDLIVAYRVMDLS